MAGVIDTTRKGIVVNRAASAFQLRQEARPNIRGKLKLHGSPDLLLDDDRACSDSGARHQIADLDFDQIATAQLAIDREVKQRSVAKSPLVLEEEPNCPYLLLRQGRLVPTIFPAFQAGRACTAGSYFECPMIILLGLDWPRRGSRKCPLSLVGTATAAPDPSQHSAANSTPLKTLGCEFLIPDADGPLSCLARAARNCRAG